MITTTQAMGIILIMWPFIAVVLIAAIRELRFGGWSDVIYRVVLPVFFAVIAVSSVLVGIYLLGGR